MERERRIGFHIKSMDELKRICSIKGVNMAELKPDKMRRAKDELYSFDGKKFKINEELAKEISDFCGENNIQVQMHLPFEKRVNPEEEEGLCYGIKQHHNRLFERFQMISELYDRFRIGKVTTMHPPQLVAKGKKICTYNDGLEYGREFLYMLDNERKSDEWEFKIGLENMVAPKEDSHTLGYRVDHLKYLLGNTETIGLTVDSGHRLLSDEMSIAKMFSMAPIASMHFHTNPGVFNESGYKDDAHQFAEPKTLEHFNVYIRMIRRFQIPVTCEIDDLNNIPDKQIQNYIEKLRFMLE